MAAFVPTKKIPQLTNYGVALQGSELLEIWSVNTSRRVTARDFVLPIDSVLTLTGMGGTLPGSRQLVAGPGIVFTDNGAGSTLQISSVDSSSLPVGLQNVALVLGNNNNVVINPNIGFFDLSTGAGAATLTGIVPLVDGQIVTISNTGPNLLTLATQSGLSTATNRFRLPANIGIVANGSYTLRYSTSIGRWVSLS